MDSQSRNYEIAYLLNPSVPEGEVGTHTGKISAIIEAKKGHVRFAEEPKKRKLAYPVKKERTAYFGWTTFTAVSSAITEIDKNIKQEQNILRHLIVEEKIERRPTARFSMPMRESRVRRETPAEPKVEERLDLEALDKKLEEILGK